MVERYPERKRTRARHFCTVTWSAIGVLVLAAAAGFVLQNLSLMIVPLIVALFPATLLAPATRQLERWHFPAALAALTTLAGGLLFLLALLAGVITLVVAQVPDVVDSADDGVERLEELVGRVFPGFEIPAADEVWEMIREGIGETGDASGEGTEGGAGEIASQGLSVAASTVEVLSGMVLMVVILFFFLKGGMKLAEGVAGFVAPRSRERIMRHAEEAWGTLGAYFQGQLLVALADAVLIGLGLFLLGVPLALPLSVIVFFGGLFPIIGAIVTGALAALVAFSDGGLGTGLAVVGIVVVVQQLEGNVLEPLIQSNAINLHPLTIILAITMGAILLGVLGAFLAVPAAAIAKQIVLRVREEEETKLASTGTGP